MQLRNLNPRQVYKIVERNFKKTEKLENEILKLKLQINLQAVSAENFVQALNNECGRNVINSTKNTGRTLDRSTFYPYRNYITLLNIFSISYVE